MENGFIEEVANHFAIHSFHDKFVRANYKHYGFRFCCSEIDECCLSFFSCNNLLYLCTRFLTSLITQYGSHLFRCEIFKDIYI